MFNFSRRLAFDCVCVCVLLFLLPTADSPAVWIVTNLLTWLFVSLRLRNISSDIISKLLGIFHFFPSSSDNRLGIYWYYFVRCGSLPCIRTSKMRLVLSLGIFRRKFVPARERERVNRLLIIIDYFCRYWLEWSDVSYSESASLDVQYCIVLFLLYSLQK